MKISKLIPITVTIIAALLLSGCGSGSGDASYKQITQEEAMQMMQEESDYLIVDVRRPDEFAEGHIKGAINVPNETIEDEMPAELPDKDQILLVYCRSGNRSKDASQKLANIGYTRVYEFGGINTWEGEIVTGGENEASDMTLLIDVNGKTLEATLENNSSAAALVELIGDDSVTVNAHDYSNFEKVGELPESLPTNDEEIDTDYGDLILYQGNRFVLYYDKNSWNFTKLGHVNNISQSELKDLLGEGDVTLVLRMK